MFYSPFTQLQQYTELWRKMLGDHMTRLEGLNAQIAGAEAQQYARATDAVDEVAKLMKASLEYSQQLSAEWRKQSLEASKQAATMFTTPMG